MLQSGCGGTEADSPSVRRADKPLPLTRFGHGGSHSRVSPSRLGARSKPVGAAPVQQATHGQFYECF